jgi:hypothetical protein
VGAPIATPSIDFLASAGNVPFEMAKLQKSLDSITSTPLDKLRDASEQAAQRTNSSIAGTVSNLAKLKKELADSGGYSPRVFRAIEKDITRYQNLGVDKSITSKLSSGLEDVRLGGLSPTQRMIEQEKQRAAASPMAKLRNDVVDKDLIYDLKPSAMPSVAKLAASELKRPTAVEALTAKEQPKPGDNAIALDATKAVLDRAALASTVGGKAMQGFRKEVESAFGELKRLKALAEQGIDVKADASKLAKTVEAAGKKHAAAAEGGGVKGVGGVLDDLIGGKLSIGKGAKFGVAGLVASFAADTLKEVSGNIVAVKNANGEFSDYARAVASAIPVISGLVTTGDNAIEMFTGYKAATDETTKVMAAQDSATKSYVQSIEDRRAKIAELTRTMIAQKAAQDAMFTGGVQGQVASIDAGQTAHLAAIANARDAAIRAAEKDAKSKTDPIDAQIKQYQGQTRRDGSLAPSAAANIAALNTTRKTYETQKADAIKAANQDYNSQAALIAQGANRQRDVAQGLGPDTKGIGDTIAQLERQVRTIDGNPIAALKKQFDELHPSELDVKSFTATLGDYQKALNRAEEQQRTYGATKGIERLLKDKSTAGLNPIEAQVQEARNALVAEPIVAKLKIRLEQDTLAKLKAQVEDSLAASQDRAGIALARKPEEKVRAEVEAESKAQERATRKGYTKEQIDALTKQRNAERVANDVGQTRERVKSPEERLHDNLDRLREQAASGKLSDKEIERANRGVFADFADATRLSRPEIVQAGSAQDQRDRLVASGKVADASNPEFQVAQESRDVLKELLSLARQNSRPAATPARLTDY